MSEDVKNELIKRIADRKVLVVTGTGISIATTGNDTLASWRGLIAHGIEYCKKRRLQEVKDRLPDIEWCALHKKLLNNGDLEDLLIVAEQVSRRLGWQPKSRCDPDWRNWLRNSVGALNPTNEELIKAIRDLGAPIVTLNYDSLLEQVTRMEWSTWQNAERWFNDKDKKILHLHGYWDEPSSVVLGIRSYETLLGDEFLQHLQRFGVTAYSLLFIGCGGTLQDPNFQTLLSWIRNLGRFEHRHYLLLRHGEPRPIPEQQLHEARIWPLYYEQHDGLPSFIHHLTPTRSHANRRRSFTSSLKPASPQSRSQLDDLIDEISRWNGLWDRDGRVKYQKVKRLVEKLSNGPLAEYAVLIEGYFLQKGGPPVIREKLDRIRILHTQATARPLGAAAAAASWQLARIRLTQGSLMACPRDQLVYFKDSVDHFKAICDDFTLDVPVLLPGIRSETPEENLIIHDPLSDPLIDVVPIPYRYTADALMALAGAHLGIGTRESVDDARAFLQDAKRVYQCAMPLFGYDEHHVIFNLQLLDLLWHTYQVIHFGPPKKRMQKTKGVIDRLNDLKADVEKKIHRLPYVKAKEWIAACHAAIACLIDSKAEHAESLKQLHMCVSEIRHRAPSLTHWLTIDPIYRLAHITRDEQMQFRQLTEMQPR